MKNVLGIDYFSLSEVANILAVSVPTVKKLITQNKMNAIKVGSRFLVTNENINKYVEENSNTNKRYFHVTHINNVPSISKDGLKANERGEIYIFDEYRYSTTIAVNQCGYNDSYAVFEINPKGIDVELISDNVAESTAKSQFIIIQNHILPKYVKHINNIFVDLKNVINSKEWKENQKT